MRSGHVQGLQVSEGLDGRLLVAVVWFLCTDVIKIITARETCVNQENESSWLCACATAHCTHMHFPPLYYRKLSEWFLKDFHFTLSKYQERKMILLSQHFYLDFHLSWGGSPLKYYQVKTVSDCILRLNRVPVQIVEIQNSHDAGGLLENTKITSGHLHSLAEPSSRRGLWPSTLIDFVSDPCRQCSFPPLSTTMKEK